ncbi:unnamed protein product [Symbiodinium sp. CCMP2592]|nr:unnamed protein product [Symbiodinium sp. CCMP2592]
MACLTATAVLLLAFPFVEGDAGCAGDPSRSRGLLQVGMRSDTFLTDSDWFLGATGQSCSDVCSAAGKFCHESGMYDVDTKEEMLAAARKVGYNCTKLYGWAYDNNPGICVDSSCCGGSCIGLCAFGTTKVRTCKGTSHYARLCECFAHAEATSTTTPAVLSPPKAKPPGFARSLFLLPRDVELMLLLATIPAASKTAGEPALLVMPQSGNDETAFLDFVEQYRPEETYATGGLSLGSLEATLGDVNVVGGGTPCEASEALARKFWSQASQLVVARCDDYTSALMAAPLAAKKSSPLVLLSHTVDLVNLAGELKVQSLVFVGSGSGPEAPGLQQIHLQTAEDVFDALGKPDYLAVTNPADRELQAYRATSALAPLLAALRGGAVLPLSAQFHSQRYKISFSDIPLSDTTTTTTQTLPDPTSICEKQCEEDGFCCGWNSGCGRPSCVLGCHIATESADVTVCQETCRSLRDGQGCFPTVAGRWANVCSSCQGSCSGHCEGEGGCEHACSLMAYAATTTTTVVVANWEIARCRMKCASDGYCCDRDSGCAAPSCKLGCEVASVSPTAVTCKERCQALTGHCFVDPVNNSLGDVALCGSCSAMCGGHCEAAGGCEYACDFVSY